MTEEFGKHIQGKDQAQQIKEQNKHEEQENVSVYAATFDYSLYC